MLEDESKGPEALFCTGWSRGRCRLEGAIGYDYSERLSHKWNRKLLIGGRVVAQANKMDKTFSIIMTSLVETGQAPFYTEIASELGVSAEQGREALHDLFEAGVSGWLFPETDYIASLAPFSNLPTQYRVSVDERQQWFAQ